jgi:hypothetical protein
MRVKLLEAESNARLRRLGKIYFVDSNESMFVLSPAEVSQLIADVRAKQNALTAVWSNPRPSPASRRNKLLVVAAKALHRHE